MTNILLAKKKGDKTYINVPFTNTSTKNITRSRIKQIATITNIHNINPSKIIHFDAH